MPAVHTHYGFAMQPGNLVLQSKRMARWLVNYHRMNSEIHLGKMPLLVYSGMSGVSYATAVALNLYQIDSSLKVGQLYIRKPEEKSHSYSGNKHNFDMFADIEDIAEMKPEIVQKVLAEKYYPVFVDDLVSSGETFMRCQKLFAWEMDKWVLLLEDFPVSPGAIYIDPRYGGMRMKQTLWGKELYFDDSEFVGVSFEEAWAASSKNNDVWNVCASID